MAGEAFTEATFELLGAGGGGGGRGERERCARRVRDGDGLRDTRPLADELLYSETAIESTSADSSELPSKRITWTASGSGGRCDGGGGGSCSIRSTCVADAESAHWRAGRESATSVSQRSANSEQKSSSRSDALGGALRDEGGGSCREDALEVEL